MEDRANRIQLSSMKASFPILLHANFATTATALGVFLVFHSIPGWGLSLAWLSTIAILALFWARQVQADNSAQMITLLHSHLRHVLYAGSLAGVFGMGMVYLFVKQTGYGQLFVAVIYTGFLTSGLLAVSMIRSLVITWAVVLAAEAYAALFLIGGQYLAGSLGALTLYIGYLVIISKRHWKVYQERFAYQLDAEEREADTVMLFEQSPLSIVVTDLDGNILHANQKALSMTGYSLDELHGRNPRVMKSGKTPRESYTDLWEKITKGQTWNGEFINRDKKGQVYVERASITPVRNPSGTITRYLAIKEDITQQRENEKQLARQNDIIALLLRNFEDQSNDWLWELDPDLRFSYVSDKTKESLGINQDSGQTILQYLEEHRPLHDVAAEELLLTFSAAIKNEQPFKELEVCVLLKGSIHYLAFSAMPIENSPVTGVGWRGVGRDITDKRLLESQLHRTANFDEQTGLPNRYRFREIIEAELHATPVDFNGLLGIVQLGNLDLVRANLGSSTCNEIISVFIKKFKEEFEDTFILARLSKDEFAFWTPEANVYQIEMINRFSREMVQPLYVGPNLIRIDAWTGIALYPEDADDMSSLFRAADLALNSTKASLTRKVMRYQQDLATAFLRRLTLINAFHTALEAEQFHMMYQPQISAATGLIIGAEALIRWIHPSLGALSPGEFVPLAENSGFITAMGEWTLVQSCAEAMSWKQPLTISINVSGVQLREIHRLSHAVKEALVSTGLPPNRLILEITESALFGDHADVINALSALRKLGIKIALDDFGTGYSSLAYLQHLQLDKLKIDQSFVRGMTSGETAGSIVAVILELAAVLHLETIAEGVELEEQATLLKNAGCDSFQGYLFGKPMTGAAFRNLVENQTLATTSGDI